MIKDKPLLTINDLKKRPLSYSSGKAFCKSPKHYIEYLSKEYEPSEFSILGQCIECMILEPEKLEQKFKIFDKFPKRTKEAKEKWIDMTIEAKENNFFWIEKDQYRIAEKCKTSLMQTKEVRFYIDTMIKSSVQKKLSWIDPKTKLPLIGFEDWNSLHDNVLTICDLKCLSNKSSPKKFNNLIYDEDVRYDLQAASYLLGEARTNFAYAYPEFVWIVVETVPPYNAFVRYMSDKEKELAKEEFRSMLDHFKYCLDNNQWNLGYHFYSKSMPYFTGERPSYFKSSFNIND